LLLLDDEVTEWMIGARFALVGGAASAYIGRRMIESSHVRQEREVLSFSCSGIIKSEEQQAKPHAITNMELVVNFDAGVVSGFTAITARIEEANANSVLFNGTTLHPSGAEWSVRGAMNRITGSLGATVTWLNRRTNDLLMRMNYELICKPTNEASGK
jgi:hypothetical protein